jgi:ATP-dependent RNA helicase DDX55/SPB4
MGFQKSISQILSMLPKQRRTGLFSATQTQEVRELARAGMRNPVTVAVKVKHDASKLNSGSGQHSSQAIPTTLENKYVICKYEERPGHLATFLTQHPADKIIVFVSTCACVDFYSLAFSQLARNENHSNLIPASMLVVGLHGKMAPKKRQGLYEKFTSSSSGVMFCTDVAARGIDIPDVDWIVQMSAPKDPSFFVHRIGRTARAGRKGGALIFMSEEEQSYAEFLVGRGVPMTEMEEAEEAGEDHENSQRIIAQVPVEIQRLCTLDRELLETSTTAFISFLRAYKEHLCSYIFRLEQLDIGSVARAYALVKLPKISETVNKKIDFQELVGVNTSTIPYRHKEKEKARLKKQELLRVQKEEEAKKARDIAADPTLAMKVRREAAMTTEKVQKVAGKESAPKEEVQVEKRKRKKKEGMHKKILDEWEELAAEEAMYKKMKRGHITREEYEDVLDTDTILEFNDVASLNVDNRMMDGVGDSDDDMSSGDEENTGGGRQHKTTLKKHLANRVIIKENEAREAKKHAIIAPKVGPKKKKVPVKQDKFSKKNDKKEKTVFTYGSKSGNKSFKKKFKAN